ncbi:hypothetical protein CDL15_Pgr020155 [Punica granatum]|uniref:MADS-box domain-containing protein n=1 Tax=Punica granatum TaxID=22663 RepID=A0A218VS59_PUNGR|nr:hypothetical protein CDL15_Pgr020155 [Punica granatum]
MRKKVKLAFITRDSSRRVTFSKRKKGLLKKVSQLSILCGVPACAIVYGQKESQLELWPPSPISVRRVISKFQEMPAMEQSKKMMNQESFLLERVARTEEQLKKLRKDNRERKMANMMYRGLDVMLVPGWLEGLILLDLKDLNSVINKTLNQIDQKQEMLGRAGTSKEVVEPEEKAEAPVEANTLVESMLREQCFKDLVKLLELAPLPLEKGRTPSSTMWSNPFLP